LAEALLLAMLLLAMLAGCAVLPLPLLFSALLLKVLLHQGRCHL
jgi:hypothetical protein